MAGPVQLQKCAKPGVFFIIYEDVYKRQPEDRLTILQAACQAPTAGNQQLYTILDITEPALKKRLSVTCDNQPFIADAPLVLLFCADCQKWYDAYRYAGCTPRHPSAGDLMLAVEDSSLAAQNAVTAAWSLGIGSCYIGDIMEHCELHRELFQLPPYVFPAVMLVLGYPTARQRERTKPARCPLDSIVMENTYRKMDRDAPVSYTHLDVYKRQAVKRRLYRLLPFKSRSHRFLAGTLHAAGQNIILAPLSAAIRAGSGNSKS